MFSYSKQKGFTLIELLVVIAIIGILSSVVLASLNSARKKGRDARRVSDLKQLQTALELYFNDNENYPIVATAAQVADGTNGLVAKGLSSTYISTIPNDPLGGTTYYWYISNASGSYYCLGATLEGTVSATSTCNGTIDPTNSTYKVGP